jgi:hypothetical protein
MVILFVWWQLDKPSVIFIDPSLQGFRSFEFKVYQECRIKDNDRKSIPTIVKIWIYCAIRK